MKRPQLTSPAFLHRNPQYVWHNATSDAQTIRQAEGGEKGTPLMLALLSKMFNSTSNRETFF